MKTRFVTTETFAAEGSNKVAYLFTGYRGKITGFKEVIRTFNDHGYTVIAYEHSPLVLSSGDPYDLLEMLGEIHQDVLRSIDKYDEAICAGVSLGVGIGFSIQRIAPQKIRYGLYAGAGVSPSASVFESPIFYFVRKAFRKNGYDPTSLYEAWSEHEISANMPPPGNSGFVIVLGKKDRIINYKKATSVYQAWTQAGIPITIITKKDLGHLGVIRWYKQNLEALLEKVEKLPPGS